MSKQVHLEHTGPAEDFIWNYACWQAEETAIKRIKFHTAYIFSKCQEQSELPVRPAFLHSSEKSGILGGGWVYDRCRKIMRSTCMLKYAQDILYSKYGMPRATDAMVEGALRSQKDRLSSAERPATEEQIEVFPDGYEVSTTKNGLKAVRRCRPTSEPESLSAACAQENIKATLEELIDAVFRKAKLRLTPLVPKPSACFEKSVLGGGQLGYLFDEFLAQATDDVKRGVLTAEREILFWDPPSTELDMMSYRPRDGVKESRRMTSGAQRIVAEFHRWILSTAWSRLDEPLDAIQAAIIEPLKVRTILAAQAAEMVCATHIQRVMHGVMRKVPIFSYIGTPDSADDLNSIFRQAAGLEYVSGDYEAATDNIKGEFSSLAWNLVADHLLRDVDSDSASFWRDLGNKALVRHRIWSKRPKVINSTTLVSQGAVEQKNGQSMGSPMSFPILCLINAACWITAYKNSPLYTRYGGMEEFCLNGGLRINGDDIAFQQYRGDDAAYQRWWYHNRQVGLYPSLGKNYRSWRFVNINSHTYVCDSECDKLAQIFPVNLAIVQDLVRKGPLAGQNSGIPWFHQKRNFDYLIKGHNAGLARRLRTEFVRHVKVPHGIPLDLPCGLGGPGFLVESPSEKAREWTAYAITRGRGVLEENGVLFETPQCPPENQAARLVKEYIQRKTLHTVVQKEATTRSRRRELLNFEDQTIDCLPTPGSKMSAQELLTYMLGQWRTSATKAHSMTGNVTISGETQMLRGSSFVENEAVGVRDPGFLRKATAFGETVAEYYRPTKWTKFNHSSLTDDGPSENHVTGSLHWADPETVNVWMDPRRRVGVLSHGGDPSSWNLSPILTGDRWQLGDLRRLFKE